jgi:hypothetical protein
MVRMTEWQDTLVLTKSDTGWLVADVAYGGTWDFGNKGTLLQGLRPGGAATFRERAASLRDWWRPHRSSGWHADDGRRDVNVFYPAFFP